MNKTLKDAAGGLALALGAAGCGSVAVVSTPQSAAQVDASIEQSFQRLRALEIVTVNRLVLELPAEATACYNLPCAGSEWVQPYQAERARQAPRLAKLADLADAANANPSLAPRDMSERDAAIQALADLRVVEVSGLIEAQPENNPDCYNQPCPADKQAARRESELRLAKVLEVVAAAKRSGL